MFICGQVSAVDMSSNGYKIGESVVGTSDLNQSSSASYQGTTAAGALAIGNSSSAGYQVEAGTKTTPDPTLSFSISGAGVNFGDFTPTSATTATATFSVINYTSYGYVVQIFGSPPSYGSHTISPMSTRGPSVSGSEQFGINLVANTLPVTLGANPNNGQFGFGSAAANYSASNQYRFVNGDTIAIAPKSSGKTIYTMSYIINVGSLTPGGQYNGNQTLVITGTY